ncbi:hypothetical protein MJO28_000708 [Puccinia striiformis f. sp. tritici]|uniref:Uncharacterized protein n=1 Tax=Puccinia striiformis f. sp. tritici TaxID=168172 RepID=A0ACC0F0M7_9BASI|nr:hypothetical protein Pst134EA_000538 [Puccinia striiformis f. sp. tritici]KAI9602061.1 hypothetical protein KEM48_001009 [Puccinia striiformis f. sp. tritici PST-130]KAH9466677.1 hypothetical protein Pst134EB_001728 [Puccinia striiformis f. sp. tritici]KAH9473465.1 hypothetical protein Pst134EA_000538 [Puccinia striiformis f. sp. tritici]KAI7962614.1 hypothetical protein MJO28_000708 [Puccinia striiformis f. sp. tritici]KAI7967263.1 hypothetical protein MJO29_000540 [Puccinia striiformis f.
MSSTKPTSQPTSAANERLQQITNHFDTRISSKKLAGKVCVLTGVGHELGIGWATAVLFAKEDAKHLYLIDLKGDSFPALLKKLKSLNPNIGLSTISGDASEENLVRSVCQKAIDEHERLDVFFANAGVAGFAPIGQTSYETSERVMRINTMSSWLALKYGSEAMLKGGKGGGEGNKARGGSIIFTASAAGLKSGAGSTEYSASKAAVISLASTGANAYPGAAIRVNAVCPGLIQTQMTGPIFTMSKDKSKIGQLCPLRRFAVADEVASVVLFLASDDSSYVNGTSIPVDGGLSSSLPVIPGKQY